MPPSRGADCPASVGEGGRANTKASSTVIDVIQNSNLNDDFIEVSEVGLRNRIELMACRARVVIGLLQFHLRLQALPKSLIH